MCKHNAEAFSLNHCCHEKAISIRDSEFVFSLNYLACNAHVLYCHLWPVWLYHSFPHYLTNGMIFGKILLNIIFVL
jgi:hypothetical protein